MKIGLSLSARIILVFFLNLAGVAGALYFLLGSQFRIASQETILGRANGRAEAAARLISVEAARKTRHERDILLKRYSEANGVTFLLYDNAGEQLGGEPYELPERLRAQVFEPRPRPEPPPARPPADEEDGPPPEERERPLAIPDPPLPGEIKTFISESSDPRRYWLGMRIPIAESPERPPRHATLLAYSDSNSGNGFFFEPFPWARLVAIITLISLLLWLPFVHRLTSTIRRITRATETIAEENFDVRVKSSRRDELGRLASAINHLAERLNGFVSGQRRFLGSISHELNSPLARMQMALTILQDRIQGEEKAYLEDAREEVEAIARLVGELIDYSKAGLKQNRPVTGSYELVPLIDDVIKAERIASGTITVAVDPNTRGELEPEAFKRAVANLLRNAVRYAGEDGPITIGASVSGKETTLTITDSGAGVPDADLDRIFDPFFRLESDRARTSGGTGLGLSIVKTCVESCGGRVFAQNLRPSGFRVSIVLRRA